MKKSCLKELFWWLIAVGIILALAWSNPQAHAYSAEFEQRANSFVEHYNPGFLPFYGYFLDVCQEYGFKELEVAILTGIMKMETLFGRTGTGRYCFNYGGLLGKNGFYCYANEYAGINAITLNWKRNYSGQGTLKWQLDKWVSGVGTKYLNDVKRTIRLLQPTN